ncbi:MAG TPA: MFS transporter [Actinomycetota bacterium]|nr:MFS transporter [Actinomycetota bacterium]
MDDVAVQERFKMLAPLALRDFRLLWTGMTVSLLGDGIFLVAVAWQVYTLWDLPSALAVVGLAMSLPQVLFLLLGGVVVDRVDRRSVMLWADVVRGLAITSIGVLSVMGSLLLWHVVVLAALYGVGSAFFGPAFDAIVPDIVAPEQLGAANSLDQFVRPAALRLAGPALGGLVIHEVGPGWAFIVDGGTFVVSIVSLLLMRRRPIQREGEGQSALRDIREGFAYVRAHTWLWGTFAAATIAYLLFMGPTEVLLPFLVKNQLGGSARTLGFIFASGGVGAIGAASIMGQRGIPRRFITFMYVAWTLATLAVAGYGLATVSWQMMAACLLCNGLETAGTIVWATTKHRLVPGPLLGRVASFDWFISVGLVPLSFALTAPVADAIGARATLVGAGVVGAVVTFAALFLPGMRSVERNASLLDKRHSLDHMWIGV